MILENTIKSGSETLKKYNINLDTSAKECKELLKDCKNDITFLKKFKTIAAKEISSPQFFKEWLERQEEIRRKRRRAAKRRSSKKRRQKQVRFKFG